MKAEKSNYLKERLSEPICVSAALAHIRYATIGNVDRRNCHPYTKTDNFQGKWILIHNGTIFDYPPLRKFLKTQKGETDSERILLYITEQISLAQSRIGRKLSFEERFELLDEIIRDMSKGNKLNLIIFDGEYLYVHTNCANSLYRLEKDDFVLFSTEPLTNENWQPAKFTTLTAYRRGKLLAEGKTHNNRYEENEESLKFLYQIFSDL